MVEAPGVDYQYLGLNLRDPVLKDVRVRQALAYAIDTHAIVEYLRRGLATPATGFCPASPGRSRPTCARIRTIRIARERFSTRPATAIRTATVRRPACA